MDRVVGLGLMEESRDGRGASNGEEKDSGVRYGEGDALGEPIFEPAYKLHKLLSSS